jgi:hypothetical protein
MRKFEQGFVPALFFAPGAQRKHKLLGQFKQVRCRA